MMAKRKKKTKKSENSLEVVSSSDEAEDADIMVCRLMTDPLIFADNHVGFCADCHRPIQWRHGERSREGRAENTGHREDGGEGVRLYRAQNAGELSMKLPVLTPDHLVKAYIILLVLTSTVTGVQLALLGPTFNGMVTAFLAGTALVGIGNSRLMMLNRELLDALKERGRMIEAQTEIIDRQQDILHHIAGHDAPTAPDERRLN
jgi:hypothetical protein